MDSLEKTRKKINEIDKEIASLFEERMVCVEEVAKYKKEHGLPVYDKVREEEVIGRNSEYITSPEIRSYYVKLLGSLMDLSKKYQELLMDGMKVAYSGVEGAFAHIASARIFPSAGCISYPSFSDAYAAVVNGECDAAVLPVENSYAGEVGQVTDLMFEGSLFVNGMYNLTVTHNLIGLRESATADIKTVISHPQALSQCAGYIKKHGFEEIKAENTALAAKTVAENGDPTIAAIASAETADLYSLKILDHDINESTNNTTRFAVFSRAERTGYPKKEKVFILLFTVNHVAGALSDALHVIAKYGFNMKVLRSRPIKTSAWQYYFYVEAEGDDASDEGVEMLKELESHCNMMKVAGHYSKEQSI